MLRNSQRTSVFFCEQSWAVLQGEIKDCHHKIKRILRANKALWFADHWKETDSSLRFLVTLSAAACLMCKRGCGKLITSLPSEAASNENSKLFVHNSGEDRAPRDYLAKKGGLLGELWLYPGKKTWSLFLSFLHTSRRRAERLCKGSWIIRYFRFLVFRLHRDSP